MYSILEIKSSEIEGICKKYRDEKYSTLTIKVLRSLSRLKSNLKEELLESGISKILIEFTSVEFITNEEEFVRFLSSFNKTLLDLSKNYGWNVVIIMSRDIVISKYLRYFKDWNDAGMA